MVGTKLYDQKGTQIYPETSADCVSYKDSTVFEEITTLYEKIGALTGDDQAVSNIDIKIHYQVSSSDSSSNLNPDGWKEIYQAPNETNKYAWKRTLIKAPSKENVSYEIIKEYEEPVEPDIFYSVYYSSTSRLTEEIKLTYNEGTNQVFDDEKREWTKEPTSVSDTNAYLYTASVSRINGEWKVTNPALLSNWSFPSILISKYAITDSSDAPEIESSNIEPEGWGDLSYDDFHQGYNYVWVINATKNNKDYVPYEANKYWSTPSLIGITVIGSGASSGDDSGGTGTTNPIGPEITAVKEYVAVWGADITSSTPINSDNQEQPFNALGVQYGDFHKYQSSAEADVTEQREQHGNTSTIYVIEITRYKDQTDAYVQQNGSYWGDFNIIATYTYEIEEEPEVSTGTTIWYTTESGTNATLTDDDCLDQENASHPIKDEYSSATLDTEWYEDEAKAIANVSTPYILYSVTVNINDNGMPTPDENGKIWHDLTITIRN